MGISENEDVTFAALAFVDSLYFGNSYAGFIKIEATDFDDVVTYAPEGKDG